VKTVAIIQSRMGSSRLPGKVMADILGKPMLSRVVTRVSRAGRIDLVTVATSTRASDDPIAEYCAGANIPCFRGSEEDVLDRIYRAASHFKANAVVRITADCPLHDPDVIDERVRILLEEDADFVSGGLLETTFPEGLAAAAFWMEVLERTWREATLRSDREHVTPYIFRNPEVFRLRIVCLEEDLSHLRWTVDEPRDLEFVRAVYAHLGDTDFRMKDILDLLQKHPEMNRINAGIKRIEGYFKSLENDDPVKEPWV
jgi:spore coat polysaccharide biosynthesis protein SpsF (cytidylyltransferase family)